jgi:predicted transposase/invertase (TIGR01784 family)
MVLLLLKSPQARDRSGFVDRDRNLLSSLQHHNSLYCYASQPLKTDSIFYRLFQVDPSLLFDLLGQSPDLAQGYEFRSVEIKQLAFRIDGVFLPKPEAADQTVWFVEVQFQKDPHFYHRFVAEISLFLDQHPQTVDWQAAVFFANRSIEPDHVHLHRAFVYSDQVHRIFLDDFSRIATASINIGLIQLVLAKEADAVTQAKALLARTQTQAQTDAEMAAIIELIETIVVYKFPQFSREEIERMLGLSELRQTKVYQEALQEGEQVGQARLLLHLLAFRIGEVPLDLEPKVQALSLSQLEALGEALFNFSEPADLVSWLQQQLT